MHSINIGPLTIILENDGYFVPVQMDVEIGFPIDSFISGGDGYKNFVDNTQRLKTFFSGLQGAFFMETSYDVTPFVIGTYDNIAVELPDGFGFSLPIISLILYHKAKAIIGDENLASVDFSYILRHTRIDVPPNEVKISLDEEILSKSKLSVLFDQLEDKWMNLLQDDEDYDPLEEDALPWWQRNDGQVRDFINMEDIDITDSNLILQVKTIMIDGEEEISDDDSGPDTDSSPEANKDESDDDGYLKF